MLRKNFNLKFAFLFLDQFVTMFGLPKEGLFHLILLNKNLLPVREVGVSGYFI